ncbi:MAG TPA: type II CAAX endopeptidase family protein [Candidatus Angelobacter sp.]|jgi:membrane protease YdiL (CAAX protease family)|nr:type II CAAX endopeptidase family protein [Candidatus Angelobacter sp.]
MLTDREGRLYPAGAFVLSVLLSCGAFVLCAYLAAALAEDHVLRFEAIFRTVLAGTLLLGFSWLLTACNHVDSHLLAAQGLPFAPGWLRQFLTGSGLGFVLVVIAVTAVAAAGKLSFHFTLNPHSLLRVAVVLLVLLAGSLSEELMFRGYPFQRLVEAIGAGGAILVFSVLFGLVHLMNPGARFWGLLNTVIIGVVFSLAYLRTRALWLPWGFHFAWNATLGLVFGLPVSGIRLFNVVVHATAAGPRWLTGGDYGLEASLPGALVVLLGLAAVGRASFRQLTPPPLVLPAGTPGEPSSPQAANSVPPPPQLGL